MNYNDLEQRLDPPQMSKQDEDALETAEGLLSKIKKLHDKAESFFEELSFSQLEDIFYKAQNILEELEDLYDNNGIVDDDYHTASWMVEELEGWYNEKYEAVMHEDK